MGVLRPGEFFQDVLQVRFDRLVARDDTKCRRYRRAREEDETHRKVVVPPPRSQLLDAKVKTDAVRAFAKRMHEGAHVDEGKTALTVFIVTHRKFEVTLVYAMVPLQEQVEGAKAH